MQQITSLMPTVLFLSACVTRTHYALTARPRCGDGEKKTADGIDFLDLGSRQEKTLPFKVVFVRLLMLYG